MGEMRDKVVKIINKINAIDVLGIITLCLISLKYAFNVGISVKWIIIPLTILFIIDLPTYKNERGKIEYFSWLTIILIIFKLVKEIELEWEFIFLPVLYEHFANGLKMTREEKYREKLKLALKSYEDNDQGIE